MWMMLSPRWGSTSRPLVMIWRPFRIAIPFNDRLDRSPPVVAGQAPLAAHITGRGKLLVAHAPSRYHHAFSTTTRTRGFSGKVRIDHRHYRPGWRVSG